jgi:(1->4)-alpha-D-glucan 1-alpha-D-glucosylmutase
VPELRAEDFVFGRDVSQGDASPELRATYRLQLSPDFDLHAARELVPYLRDLGISHLYLSPSLQARSGSTHGYDVVDPTRVSEALGGEDALRALAAEGLGVILDIVPNHMGTGEENRWWAGTPGPDPEIFDIDPQSGWYRRFFDIDDLAAVRVERREVFDLLHGKVLELVRDGVLAGVRVDHPDGLADPAGYLRRLRDAGVAHVWVEKILAVGEGLRDWPVDGTVGYEFLVDVGALFVDPAGEAALTDLWQTVSGDRRPFEEVALAAQLEQATGTFAREVDRLRVLLGDDDAPIPEALAELPVYRTYVEPWSGAVAEEDRSAVEAAGIAPALARVLLLDERGNDEFVTRFQQTSPPVAAKGVEDTAFYRYGRLLALNEVGGEPARFGVSPADFHAANVQRARRFPRNLLVTSTHDTKRSADARARIGALAAVPDAWREAVSTWLDVTRDLVTGGAPDGAERYMLLQNLLAAWPISAERLEAYVEKSLREAKVHTTWAEPDEAYEAAVKRYATGLLTHEAFRASFEPFLERLVPIAERHALGQLLLKLTVPGLPDVYGGDELWFLALVDPDNRRPVDWAARRQALDALRGGAAPARETVKLWLIWRALALRARRPEAFAGAYTPLDAPPGTVAFLRGDGEVLVAVRVREDAEPFAVPEPERWRDVLEGAPGDYGLVLLERADAVAS